MNGTFKLTIVLGNDAMRTRRNVARALREVAKHVAAFDNQLGEGIADALQQERKIMDVNGNSVGEWSFTPED